MLNRRRRSSRPLRRRWWWRIPERIRSFFLSQPKASAWRQDRSGKPAWGTYGLWRTGAIDANGVDGSKFAMFQSKGDDVFHRVENFFPWSAEGFGCFLPWQSPRPAGQKQHVGSGQRALAVAPRHFLNDDRLTPTAIDASHGIKQKDQKAPEGDELVAAYVRSLLMRNTEMGLVSLVALHLRARPLARGSSWKLHAVKPHRQFERRTEASVLVRSRLLRPN